MPNIVIGVLFLLGGIAATFFTNGQRVWYGAMIVGAISIVRGIIRLSTGTRS